LHELKNYHELHEFLELKDYHEFHELHEFFVLSYTPKAKFSHSERHAGYVKFV